MTKVDQTVIAVIPARGGSKGLPRKNIKSFAGSSLLAIAVKSAVAVTNQIIVTSDDKEILELANSLGVCSVERAAELATDDAPTSVAIFDVIEKQALSNDDCIILLQPTSPLRTHQHVEQAYELFLKSSLPVISIEEGGLYPDKYLAIKDGKTFSDKPELVTSARQNLQAYYRPNGAIYIFSVQMFLSNGDVPVVGAAPFFMSKKASIDIDDINDFRLAEVILENQSAFDS